MECWLGMEHKNNDGRGEGRGRGKEIRLRLAGEYLAIEACLRGRGGGIIEIRTTCGPIRATRQQEEWSTLKRPAETPPGAGSIKIFNMSRPGETENPTSAIDSSSFPPTSPWSVSTS